MWSDPILSGITFLILTILAICISLALCVFSPNQVFWFGGLSFFTPPELQDYIIINVFQQIAKVQEYLLSAFTRKKPSAIDSLSDTNNGNENNIEHTPKKRSISSSSTNATGVTAASTSATTSATAGATANVTTGKSLMDVTSEDSDDEIQEFEAFDPNLLFSYNWMKEQTYRWLLMTPDDTELRHRHICSLAVVTKDQVRHAATVAILL